MVDVNKSEYDLIRSLSRSALIQHYLKNLTQVPETLTKNQNAVTSSKSRPTEKKTTSQTPHKVLPKGSRFYSFFSFSGAHKLERTKESVL